jgi:hypothetical protein
LARKRDPDTVTVAVALDAPVARSPPPDAVPEDIPVAATALSLIVELVIETRAPA